MYMYICTCYCIIIPQTIIKLGISLWWEGEEFGKGRQNQGRTSDQTTFLPMYLSNLPSLLPQGVKYEEREEGCVSFKLKFHFSLINSNYSAFLHQQIKWCCYYHTKIDILNKLCIVHHVLCMVNLALHMHRMLHVSWFTGPLFRLFQHNVGKLVKFFFFNAVLSFKCFKYPVEHKNLNSSKTQSRMTTSSADDTVGIHSSKASPKSGS